MTGAVSSTRAVLRVSEKACATRAPVRFRAKTLGCGRGGGSMSFEPRVRWSRLWLLPLLLAPTVFSLAPTVFSACSGKEATAPSGAGPVSVASVAVAPATATVPVGQTVQLTATTKDANGTVLTGRTVTWATSNAALATVSGSGVVTGVAAGGPVTITATSEGQSGTAAITVTPPSGDLYVSTIFDGSVWHYDVTGQLVRSVVSNLGTLSVGGLAFGSDCNLYVGLANPLSASAAVAVFSGATDAPLRLFVPFIAAGSQPGPIAFGSDGSLYVATQNPDAVLRYDATGQLVHTFLLPVPATDMTASNGIVYVSTGASTAVFSIDVQTATVTTFVDVSVGTPVGITFDGAGNFYAVQTVVSSILPTLSGVLRFTGPGVPGQPFVSSDPRLNGGLGEATDLAFGGDGNLYVLSVHGNALLRYHGTDGTFDQAFAAIPASGLAGGPLHLAFKPPACH